MTYEEKYDLCVIGAGSAGLSVAAGASQLGLKTALIERSKMGGDCLNTGCVPSKSLLQAAKTAYTFRKSEKFGVKSLEPEIDFAAVKDHVHEIIKAIEPNDSQERFEGLGVAVIRDQARFLDRHTVEAGTRVIRARYFVIAAGSRAVIPPIEGLDPDKVFTNENIFDLREKPEHLVIIGGGPIGTEMAQAHLRLGARVSVLDIGTILPKDDPELTAILRKGLIEEGLELYEGVNIQNVRHGKHKVIIRVEKEGEEFEVAGTHLMVAAGRRPNTDTLDLERAGVKYGRRGIETDKRLRSSQKHVLAAGDIAGGPQFTHVAGYHAGIIIRNIAFKIPAKVNYKALPWVTYTDPELANVGMTQSMADKEYGKDNIRTVSWSFKENDRAWTERRTEGLIKVTAKKNGKILGAAITGANAGELIGLWALAISKGMKIGGITGVIIPYPTLGEVSKRAAGEWFTASLFSERTRKIVRILQKIPLF
jgi:pyruvate/2-oxoglutarate dehydrogenase complex dihydrolipoamide dehydrogenase (E3) component